MSAADLSGSDSRSLSCASLRITGLSVTGPRSLAEAEDLSVTSKIEWRLGPAAQISVPILGGIVNMGDETGDAKTGHRGGSLNLLPALG